MSGFFVPHDLKAPIKGAAHGPLAGLNAAVKDLAAEGRLAALGIEPYMESPQFFAKYMAEDHDRSAKLLKAANFKPE